MDVEYLLTGSILVAHEEYQIGEFELRDEATSFVHHRTSQEALS